MQPDARDKLPDSIAGSDFSISHPIPSTGTGIPKYLKIHYGIIYCGAALGGPLVREEAGRKRNLAPHVPSVIAVNPRQ
jgi:hypothetical protein